MVPILVRDFANYSPNYFDVLMQFMFGGSNVPEPFQPNKTYSAGDLVYVEGEDGKTIIMQANGNGAFPSPDPPNWREYDLDRALTDMNRIIEKNLGFRSRIGNQVYEPHTLQYPSFHKDTEQLNGLDIGEWLNQYSYAEVYIDGRYVPRKYWELTADDLSFTPEYLLKMPKVCAVTILVNKAVSIVARMIKRLEIVETADSKTGHIIPYPPQSNDYDIRLEVYVNGAYCPNTRYTLISMEDKNGEDKVGIAEWEGDIADSYELTFRFTYSCTNEVTLMHVDFETVIKDERESFMLDLTTVDFVNQMQEIRLFRNSVLLGSDRYGLSKGYVNFWKREHYLPLNSVIYAPIMTYLLPEYEEGDVRHNSQTTPVFENGEDQFTIPFLSYNPASHDVILFNDSGVLISDVKWGFDGYEVRFFEHDMSMTKGDRIDFRMINQDETVKVQNFWFTANEDDQRVFTGKTDFSQYQLIMVFTTSGMYIPSLKYQINGSTLTLNESIELKQFDRIQVITFRYIYKESNTTFDVRRYVTETDGQTEFPNPYTDYNPVTDGLYIFTQNGKYIGERFYEINGKNIRLSGDPLTFGGYVEIVLIRNLTVTIQTGVV